MVPDKDKNKKRSGTGSAAAAPEVLLVIESGHSSLEDAHESAIIITKFDNLDKALLAKVNPDCVLCHLVSPGFDAAMVIARLDQLEFLGRVAVITPPLPNPKLVLNELQSMAPGLIVQLIDQR